MVLSQIPKSCKQNPSKNQNVDREAKQLDFKGVRSPVCKNGYA